MFVLKLCCIALITAVCAFVLKNNKSDLVPLCLTAGGIIMFLYSFDYLSESVEFLRTFADQSGIDSEIIRTVFKIVGIGFIIEITADSVKELGFAGVADKLILCGKIILFIVAVPILSATYKVIVALINLT